MEVVQAVTEIPAEPGPLPEDDDVVLATVDLLDDVGDLPLGEVTAGLVQVKDDVDDLDALLFGLLPGSDLLELRGDELLPAARRGDTDVDLARSPRRPFGLAMTAVASMLSSRGGRGSSRTLSRS